MTGKELPRNRVVATLVLLAALGLMVYPPMRVNVYAVRHHFLWGYYGGRPVAWGNLALEFCLLMVIAVLALTAWPIVGSWRAKRLRRAAIVLASAGGLLIAGHCAFHGAAYIIALRHYRTQVQDFRNRLSYLQRVYPLIRRDRTDHLIKNIAEGEYLLRRFRYSERQIAIAHERLMLAGDWEPLHFDVSNPPVDEIYLVPQRSSQYLDPLPAWYSEALAQGVGVGFVPDTMKPGTEPQLYLLPFPLAIPAITLLLLAGVLCLAARRMGASPAS